MDNPTCTECGATTNQFLHGWEKGWTEYKCGFCQKVYKIEEEGDG